MLIRGELLDRLSPFLDRGLIKDQEFAVSEDRNSWQSGQRSASSPCLQQVTGRRASLGVGGMRRGYEGSLGLLRGWFWGTLGVLRGGLIEDGFGAVLCFQ